LTVSLPTLEWLLAWREPVLTAGQVLLIILLVWMLQRLLTRCVTLLGKRYPQLPAELLSPLRGLIGAGQYVVAGVGAFGRLGAGAVMQLAPG
jgi:hypothetical protein